MNTRLAALSVTFLVLDCAAAIALPSCAGRVELTNARFMRIDEKTAALDFAGGRVVQLEGIRLPAGAVDHAPAAFASSALSAIVNIARSGAMTLAVTPPELDRYRRLRAQAFIGERWLQSELLDRGLARVSVAPDRTECASELFAI